MYIYCYDLDIKIIIGSSKYLGIRELEISLKPNKLQNFSIHINTFVYLPNLIKYF